MRLFLSLAACAIVAATPTSLAGQVANPLVPADQGFALDITKPLLEDDGYGSMTSVVRPTGFFAVGDRATLVVRVPLVLASYEGADGSTTLGNLDVGVAFRNADGMPLGEISIILPTAQEWGGDDYATGVGMLTDVLYGERYVSTLWSVHGAFTPTREIEGGTVGLRLGTSVWIPKEDGDAEVIARYGAYVSKTSGNARFGLEFSGMALVSESDISFNDRTVHEIGGSIGLVGSGAAPELFVRVPVDEDVRDFVKANVGIRITF